VDAILVICVDSSTNFNNDDVISFLPNNDFLAYTVSISLPCKRLCIFLPSPLLESSNSSDRYNMQPPKEVD
jgi:hypothetical protein